MSWPRLSAIGFAAVFAVAAVGAFAEKPVNPEETGVRALMMQKRDLLQQRAAAVEQSYLTGQVAHADVVEAKVDLIRSQIDLASSHSERLEILESQVQLYRGLEQVAEGNFSVGKTNRSELLKIKANRIDAEIALLREQQ